MHQPSRARRILKWTGVGLLTLNPVIWILSLQFGFQLLITSSCNFSIWGGQVALSICDFDVAKAWPNSAFTFTGIRKFPSKNLGVTWPIVKTGPLSTGHMTMIAAPLWLLLLFTAIPTAWLWHRDSRLISSSSDHRLCLRCGYDLTGNTSGICSECGERRPNVAGTT